MNSPLRICGLSKSYGSFALRDISIEAPAGCLVGLVGPNGAGKTTTIKAALGLVRPDAGEITLCGRKPGDPALAGQVGVVMEQPCLPGDWRVSDAGRALHSVAPAWDLGRYAELCSHFGLDPRAKISTLSRGMGMKVQIAVALASDPRLLILDEPTSGLDPLARDDLLELLGDFLCREDRAVLFSTQITTDLDRIADVLYVVVDGRLVAAGPRDDVLDCYVVAHGGPEELEALRGRLIAPRIYPHGFDALMRADTTELPSGVVTERPTVADLVIHLGKAA